MTTFDLGTPRVRPAPRVPPRRMGLGVWAWLLQRVTGIALTASVVLHFLSKTVLPLPTGVVLANDSLLITLVVYHALNGIRVVLIDLGPGLGARRAIFWGCVGVGAVAAGVALAVYLGPRM